MSIKVIGSKISDISFLDTMHFTFALCRRKSVSRCMSSVICDVRAAWVEVISAIFLHCL